MCIYTIYVRVYIYVCIHTYMYSFETRRPEMVWLRTCLMFEGAAKAISPLPPYTTWLNGNMIEKVCMYTCIYKYAFETRKVWNGWFWKKKNLIVKEEYIEVFQYFKKHITRNFLQVSTETPTKKFFA